ncbi:MAG: peptide chain release factor N(5)-glutamine methyltransferase [Solirubrobacterales bacterium]|nr:peptide chain release factor N(5)-glutamine methyltransferase [Solirubrobacterales bacterium]
MTPAAAATVGEALAAATDAIAASGSASPRLDAELLLAAATGSRRESFATEPERCLDGPEARAFGALVRRRVGHEPVAYILGHRGFRRIELRTDARALIPRPETEELVDLALELEPERVLDIGTGSGAVALAVADELPGAEIVAVDVSAAAAALARENAAMLGLADRVRVVDGPVASAEGEFDLALANLPYVREDERGSLPPDVVDHEPHAALFAGTDGLGVIRDVLVALAPGGAGPRCAAVGLEVGAGQAREVAGLVGAAGYPAVSIRPDLAGIERVVVGRR